jgi:hypothetical protein
MVDTPWTETTLCDLKSPTFAQEHVAHRNSDVLEDNFSMVMDVAEDPKWAQDGDARRFAGDKNHGVLIVK